MNRLEYYILKLFQEMMIKSNFETRYIYIENNLLALVKGENELELYIKTELVLDGRGSASMKFSKVMDGFYKISWSDQFLYLIGEKQKEQVSNSSLNKELELLRVSSNPLSNYIKTL